MAKKRMSTKGVEMLHIIFIIIILLVFLGVFLVGTRASEGWLADVFPSMMQFLGEFVGG